MYDMATRMHTLSLLADGRSMSSVSKETGVSRASIRSWRVRVEPVPRRAEVNSWTPPADTASYSYLLGLYLGDGHISQPASHRVPSLRITCDDKWPGLMNAAEEAMRKVLPYNQTCRARKLGCHDVKVYSKHLVQLFPQHGPGKKHDRRITLEDWQQAIVDAHPWEFVRGLIHSDGCRITNWTVRNGKRYEYPRYFFTNKSDDIRKLCTDTLAKVGVQWTILARGSDPFNVSIARKASVALMDEHIGPKY
ncbi:transcriptional regulator [Streptomyces sp. NBC_00503]|uniref:transcriptional regulator n=1 Tax=Streptomyces sp. NBC_00503 TaxID=2903659 RepID=UPI002E8238DD|nr:transcriptional regulator [Streptomyces sp. NBC_00503]WUD80769.1 transcriptional regulator [Streptomyces sp. NBC_00503]